MRFSTALHLNSWTAQTLGSDHNPRVLETQLILCSDHPVRKKRSLMDSIPVSPVCQQGKPALQDGHLRLCVREAGCCDSVGDTLVALFFSGCHILALLLDGGLCGCGCENKDREFWFWFVLDFGLGF